MSDDTTKKKTEAKKVKLKAVREVLVDKVIKKPGEVFEVDEETASELTKPIKLHLDGWGEGSYKPTEMRRCIPA